MEEIRKNPLRSKESGQDIPIVVLKLECAWERMGGLDKHSGPSIREPEAWSRVSLLWVVLRPHLEKSCLVSWWGKLEGGY